MQSRSFSTLGHLMLRTCHSSLNKGLPSFHIIDMVPRLNNSIPALTVSNLVSAVMCMVAKNMLAFNFKKKKRGGKGR